jgi:predicted ATPase
MVLLVVTFHLEFLHVWSRQPHVTMLALKRLGRCGGVCLPPSVLTLRSSRPLAIALW